MFAELTHGRKIYYELSGTGNNTLVLIAGYRGDHSAWELVQDKLSSQYKILVFDNLGIGQTTDNGDPLTIETMADVAMELICKLGIKKPNIVGQSMGGAIAQVVANKYSDKIHKLVILNSVMKFNQATLIALESLLKLREENASTETLFRLGLPWSFSSRFLELDANIQAYKNKLLSNPYPQSIENQNRQFNALKNFDSREWIYKIRTKAMVIASNDDIVTLPSETRELASHLKHAEFLSIQGGHASLIESSHEVSQVISDFIS